MDATTITTYFIAGVWLGNGLFAKVLDLVPRHRMIVGRILGERHARSITILIGIAEICMAIWIVSGIMPLLNTLMQIGIVAAMNILEFILAPDLLLFGRKNAVIAALLIALIAANGFVLN